MPTPWGKDVKITSLRFADRKKSAMTQHYCDPFEIRDCSQAPVYLTRFLRTLNFATVQFVVKWIDLRQETFHTHGRSFVHCSSLRAIVTSDLTYKESTM